MDPLGMVWTTLSVRRMRDVYMMFEKGDTVAAAVRQLKTHSLYGGIGYTWEGGQKVEDFDELDREWITDLVRAAIDWKLMFGMCPFREELTAENRPSIVIPELGRGQFMARLGETGRTEVGWLTEQGRLRGSVQPDTRVFVWPDHTPDTWIAADPYRSVGARLFKADLEQKQLRQNVLVADWTASRPPLITQHVARPPGMDRQDETEIFADMLAVGANMETAENQQMYRVNRETRSQQEVHASAVTYGSYVGSAPAVGRRGQLVDQVHLNAYQQGLFPLPVGQMPARYQMPQSRPDTLSWLSRWETIVRREIGVPRDDSVSGDYKERRSSARYSAGAASQLEDSVKAIRTDMGRFFEFSFRVLRSSEQDGALAGRIRDLEKSGAGLEKLQRRFEDHFYGRTEAEIAKDKPALEDARIRSRREGVLRRRLARELSMGRAEVDVLDRETLDVLLGARRKKLSADLQHLTNLIQSRTRLHLIWKEPLVLNWEFVFRAYEQRLLPDQQVQRMVCAKFGLPFDACAAGGEEPPPKRRKTDTDRSADKSQRKRGERKSDGAKKKKKAD